MEASNSIQAILNDIGAVITSSADGASTWLDKIFVVLLSLDLVLWFFLPFVILIVLWRISTIATRMGQVAVAVSRLSVVLADAAKEQTMAIHHLRDKTQSSIESLKSCIDAHRDGVAAGTRDVTKSIERLEGRIQFGSQDVAKQLANIYDRFGKYMTLSGMEGVGDQDFD